MPGCFIVAQLIDASSDVMEENQVLQRDGGREGRTPCVSSPGIKHMYKILSGGRLWGLNSPLEREV